VSRPTNDELNHRRTNPPGTRDELRKQLEARVTRWEWATGSKYRFEPFYKELDLNRWGKTLKEAPSDPVDHHQFGFDAEERLLIEREFHKYNGVLETFLVRTERFLQRFYYASGDAEVATHYCEIARDGDRFVYFAAPGQDAIRYFREYEYEGGKLARLVEWKDDGKQDVVKFQWNGNRLEQLARHYAHGHVSVLWTAKPPSLSRATRAMSKHLPGLIQTVVADANIVEPAFCLLLAYSKGSELEMSLPKVVIGLERERARMLADGDTAEDIFNPAGLELFDDDALDLEHDDVLAASEEMARAMKDDADFDKVRKLYVKLAKALNKVDWTPHLTPTDDFVVLAVDDEVAELFVNAKGGLSAKQRKAHGLSQPKK
jgi:hypothetical protein